MEFDTLAWLIRILSHSFRSVGSFLLTSSSMYFALLAIDYFLGHSIRTGIIAAWEVFKKWMGVASVVAFSFGIAIKSWELPLEVYEWWNTDLIRGASGVLMIVNVAGFCVVLLLVGIVVWLVLRVEKLRAVEVVREVSITSSAIPEKKIKESRKKEQKVEEEERIIEILSRIQERLYTLEKGMALNFQNQKVNKEERKVISAIPAASMVPLRTPTNIICYSCGKTGHWRKNCLVRQYRCTKCHKLGHISSACQNFTIKDPRGRVRQLVQVKPSRIHTEAAMDSNTAEKVITAQGVLDSVLELSKRRAINAQKRRQTRRQMTGEERKRRIIEHPVGGAFEGSEDEDDENIESDDEMADITTMLRTLASKEVAIDEGNHDV